MAFTRREFLRGIGLAAGGVAIPSVAYDRLIPYLNQPEDIVPGVSTWFATSCRECPAGCGMVVRNRESRVVKCEGNPLHPFSRGKLCPRGQAAPQGLYDPDRIRQPLRRSELGKLEPVSWDSALSELGDMLARKPRVAVMTDLQTGTLDALMRAWLAALGSDRLITYEPISYEHVKDTNGGLIPTYEIAKSDFLISFACDFLETWVSPIEYAIEFAKMREIRDGKRAGFVYVGPRVSMTAANADVRLMVSPDVIEQIATAFLEGTLERDARKYGIDPDSAKAATDGFAAAKRPLALPGLAANTCCGTAIFNARRDTGLVNRSRRHALSYVSSAADVDSFTRDTESGVIGALVIHNANPVYAMPQSERFTEALKRVPVVISLSSHLDETTAMAGWVLPSNTPLESWGDYAPYPDVVNLMQPAMGTLFDTRQAGDTLLALARAAGVNTKQSFKADTFVEYLRTRWSLAGEPWQELLQRGGKFAGAPAGLTATPITGYNTLGDPPVDRRAASLPGSTADPHFHTAAPSIYSLRLWAFPDSYLYDGRGANKWWLQETPEPVVKGVWGSWAEIHPSTAAKLGVSTNDCVKIENGGASVSVPVYVWNGVKPGTIAIPMGEGHTDYGQFARGVGVNIWPLLTEDVPLVNVTPGGGTQWVARIRGSTDQSHRAIVQTASLGENWSREKPIIMPLPSGYGKRDFYPGNKYKKHRWAMVVDLDRCIGCHACVTACYAENNLGMVGAEGVFRRREMSWIRIDRYVFDSAGHGYDIPERRGDAGSSLGRLLFQPMLCQQCDAAPCEPVCPVFAASHSEEGLNMQVYNRCVGTRYCSNNCPYKVRRFNWWDYKWPEPLNWQLNPDVTVRCRGVMEKCTFCVQRIRQAEITALREQREVMDGEITPACVQTCPTGVFTFGDLMDKNSRVSSIIETDPRAYQVLAELNTKPAVIYLKKVI